jgi:tetratricopeptide (TPR) repeat protein
MVPFTIKVPNMTELYVQSMRHELENTAGFTWQGWNDAANYCVMNKTNLDEALKWSDNAINLPGIGQENFTSLSTKAQVLDALGRKEESSALMQKAINHPTASALQVHFYGRQLIGQGKKDEALKVFQQNAKMHPNQWPVNVGLARGYSGVGDYKNALKYAKLAYAEAPDEGNKNSLKAAIEKLEKGQDMN